MQDKLSIAAIQLDSTIGQPLANIESLSLALNQLPHSIDVAVLPELLSTGYISDPSLAQALAEPVDGNTITSIRELSHKHSMAICGSYLAKDNDALYNRGFFIEPSGETTYYDKHHLFSLSEEAKVVRPGMNLPPVMRFRGWNIAMAICYDLRFPAWLRNLNLAYDVMLVPANWPEKRSFAWTHLLQARAIENQAYIVGANRGGSDEFGVYQGQTFIYDYMGKSIGRSSDLFVMAQLDKEYLNKFRTSFPVWKDADDFELCL